MRVKELIKCCLLQLGCLVNRDKRRSKILYYHDVTPEHGESYTDMSTPFALFAAHVAQVKRAGFEIVPRIESVHGQVLIAFDDGFRGVYENRARFVEWGVKPTIFLATTLVGKPGYMTADEIRELQELGFVFQCHTVSHTNLQKFAGDDLRRQVEDSKRELSEMLGREVDEICFPQGYYSDTVVAACRKAGYKKMYTSVPGDYEPDSDLVCRNLCQFEPMSRFKLILKGGMNLLRGHYLKRHYKNI